MSARVTRHSALLYMTEAPEAVQRALGEGIVGGFLSSKFAPETAFGLVKPIVMSTLEVCSTAVEKLLPTPSKLHYGFSLRDVRRVFQVRGLSRLQRLPLAALDVQARSGCAGY